MSESMQVFDEGDQNIVKPAEKGEKCPLDIEIVPFTSLPEATQEQVARLLAAYTNGQLGELPQMLPVSAADIYAKHAGFTALHGPSSALVGYVGALPPALWNGQPMCEVGSLWVSPSFRKQGIAHAAVRTITAHLLAAHELPYAFCNPLSEPIFEQSGYREASSADVPSSALSACSTCPLQPAHGCCDKILVYGGTA
ncbi:MAG TPA: GNAT family N-acetyltransferase [Candidatus Saccharimonadales bacterium]|nr:GNAT family N-acetyltransferase [Candidatus Saccharimonadales bacterium]